MNDRITSRANESPPYTQTMPTEHWRKEADNWVRWARTPGHDAYWDYRDSFFDIVPPPGRKTIEVGCGEGRVARDLTSRGHDITAIDASSTMIRYARDADDHGAYVVADAASLPFPSASFDLAIAYNSLMDVDDMPAAVAETTPGPSRLARPARRSSSAASISSLEPSTRLSHAPDWRCAFTASAIRSKTTPALSRQQA